MGLGCDSVRHGRASRPCHPLRWGRGLAEDGGGGAAADGGVWGFAEERGEGFDGGGAGGGEGEFLAEEGEGTGRGEDGGEGLGGDEFGEVGDGGVVGAGDIEEGEVWAEEVGEKGVPARRGGIRGGWGVEAGHRLHADNVR